MPAIDILISQRVGSLSESHPLGQIGQKEDDSQDGVAFTQLSASDVKGFQHRPLEILTHVDHGVDRPAANNQEKELQVALLQAGLRWIRLFGSAVVDVSMTVSSVSGAVPVFTIDTPFGTAGGAAADSCT